MIVDMTVTQAIDRVLNLVNGGLERADVQASDYRTDGDKGASCRPVRVSAYTVDSGRTTRIDITNYNSVV